MKETCTGNDELTPILNYICDKVSLEKGNMKEEVLNELNNLEVTMVNFNATSKNNQDRAFRDKFAKIKMLENDSLSAIRECNTFLKEQMKTRKSKRAQKVDHTEEEQQLVKEILELNKTVNMDEEINSLFRKLRSTDLTSKVREAELKKLKAKMMRTYKKMKSNEKEVNKLKDENKNKNAVGNHSSDTKLRKLKPLKPLLFKSNEKETSELKDEANGDKIDKQKLHNEMEPNEIEVIKNYDEEEQLIFSIKDLSAQTH